MVGLYRGANRYEVSFIPLANFSGLGSDEIKDSMQAAQSRYVALLEECCRKAPDNWFNFFDFWQDKGGH